MKANKGFLKDLKIIDPTYYPVWNEKYQYWEIKRHFEVYRRGIIIQNPTVATFRYLNDNALDSMRKRKQIGLKYAERPGGWLNEIVANNKNSRIQKKAIAHDMMAEGLMWGYNLGKRKIFT